MILHLDWCTVCVCVCVCGCVSVCVGVPVCSGWAVLSAMSLRQHKDDIGICQCPGEYTHYREPGAPGRVDGHLGEIASL